MEKDKTYNLDKLVKDLFEKVNYSPTVEDYRVITWIINEAIHTGDTPDSAANLLCFYMDLQRNKYAPEIRKIITPFFRIRD